MKFWKYEGIGNDFVLLEDWDDNAPKDPDFVIRMCNRNFGVGGDGVLYLSKSDRADCSMRMMNPDGTE